MGSLQGQAQVLADQQSLLAHTPQQGFLQSQDLLGTRHEVQGLGSPGQYRQGGGLRRRKVGGGLLEVAPGRRLQAVGSIPVVRAVQPGFQDLPLGEVDLQAHGIPGLQDLGSQPPGPGRSQTAGQLLGYGRAPGQDLAGSQVDPDRAQHGRGIQTGVVPEAAILGQQGGLHRRRSHVVKVNPVADPVPTGGNHPQGLPVPVQQGQGTLLARAGQLLRQGPEKQDQPRQEQRQQDRPAPAADHRTGFTSTAWAAVVPKTSGWYISSARVAGRR